MEYDSHEDDIFYDSFGMKVWEKRHAFVSGQIHKNNCHKIVDFGMAEGRFLERLTRSQQFELLVGIDIDEGIIQRAIRILQPYALTYQYQLQRNQELKVQLYKGSVFDNYQELKNMNLDCCTMIEVIEHVQLSELEMIENNVFGFLNIPLVIVTTPNQDFNRFFPFFKDQPTSFRHYDHKYEFTQVEFQNWCQKICDTYDYEFEIFGIGPHKSGDLQYGYCSQVSIFKKMKNQMNEHNSRSIDLELDLKADFIYPTNKVDHEQELLDFIHSNFNIYLNDQNDQNEYYNDSLKITELLKHPYIQQHELIQNSQQNIFKFLNKMENITFSQDNQYFQFDFDSSDQDTYDGDELQF